MSARDMASAPSTEPFRGTTPAGIRRTSVALGLRSEASLRFEKGVDTTRVLDSANYAAYLMQKLGWARVLDTPIDVYPLPYKARCSRGQ